MAAYYNEFEPYAAEWLRNLISAGLIADGDVDERSILDVRGSDLRGYTQCHFFAGIGGWSLALRLAGWPDDRPVWTGSCPCQPFSNAGKREGQKDERHLWPEFFRLIRECRPSILFGEQVAAAIGKQWLDGVYSDLEGEDYACGAAVLPACAVNAPHRRDRLWFVADGPTSGKGWRRIQGPCESQSTSGEWPSNQPSRPCNCDVADHAFGRRSGSKLEIPAAPSERSNRGLRSGRPMGYSNHKGLEGWQLHSECVGQRSSWSSGVEWLSGADGKARRVKSGVCLLAHGVSGRVAIRRTHEQGGTEIEEEHWYNRVGALKAFGNAIVPQVAAAFISAYLDI